MKLRALKTFSAGGAQLTFQGEVFEASKAHAEEYLRLELAEVVEEGTAETVAEPTTELEQAVGASDYTEAELLEKNVTELKRIAKNIGVTGYTSMSKAEVVFAILAQQNANKAKLEG